MVVVGAGGYARSVIDALRLAGVEIRGCFGREREAPADYATPVPYLGDDDALLAVPPASVMLVNAVGSTGPTEARRAVFERYRRAGFRFAGVVHPRAVVAGDVRLGEGVHVHANAVLQPGVEVGDDCIVDLGAVVAHDCRLGAHVHLSPGVVFSGGVEVGDGAHVGTGATVIQGMSIGAGAMVAAGAVVVRPVAAGGFVLGVPARERQG